MVRTPIKLGDMVARERDGAIGNNDIEVQFLLLNVTFTLVCAIFRIERFSHSDDERAFNEIAFFLSCRAAAIIELCVLFKLPKGNC